MIDKQHCHNEKIPTKYSKWVIECFIDTVKEIRESIIEYPNLRLIGSSLLFIYEGDRKAADKTWEHMLKEDSNHMPAEDKEEEEELSPKMCDLRLIDFAHSDWHAERKEQDPELMKGFDNIIQILENCLKRQNQENL
jgi:1D-myo-inositol-tetrakisphosphate 5-kinase/inositol-polyphosphate multikinase